MTISGLVSHLRWVESAWIEQTLVGGTIDAPWTDDDPDREFRIAVTVPLARLLADYRAACARHRDSADQPVNHCGPAGDESVHGILRAEPAWKV
jgi:hypothetical protein